MLESLSFGVLKQQTSNPKQQTFVWFVLSFRNFAKSTIT